MKATPLALGVSFALGALSATTAVLRQMGRQRPYVMGAEEYTEMRHERARVAAQLDKLEPKASDPLPPVKDCLPVDTFWTHLGPDGKPLWQCWQCGAENLADWRWCGRCGADTQHPAYRLQKQAVDTEGGNDRNSIPMRLSYASSPPDDGHEWTRKELIDGVHCWTRPA
jgi:hypothetical protein